MQNPTPRISDYDLVAEISKTKGVDGQLVAYELGRLSVLHQGLEVWVVPPTLNGIRHTVITDIRYDKHKSGILLSLEGVTNRTQASELIGKCLLAQVRQGDGVRTQEDGVRTQEDGVRTQEDGVRTQGDGSLVLSAGDRRCASPCSFSDSNYGLLGTLEYIKPGPAYEIWIVSGPYGELEIPAVDEYIVAENTEQVILTLPKDFIEITGKGTQKCDSACAENRGFATLLRDAQGDREERVRSAQDNREERVRSAQGDREERVRSAQGDREERVRSAQGDREERVRDAH